MQDNVPSSELESRMSNFRLKMDEKHENWKYAAIFGKINQYYFTGTMQDGVLIIPRDESAVFFVRSSYSRAVHESEFKDIRQINSFRDAATLFSPAGIDGETVFLDSEVISYAHLQRFLKYFKFKNIASVDSAIADTRSVKSEYELGLMIKSGEIHRTVTEDIAPDMLYEGITEAEFGTELFKALISEGHQGIVRFGMFDNEIVMGHIGFGENSIYASYFNGASGNCGIGPYAPVLGSSKRKLKKGDLVYLDIGCGYHGYQTDKTMTYMYGKSLSESAIEIHNRCVDIQNEISSMLKPGNIPSQIYNDIINSLDDDFKKNFMGYKNRKVKFLGHGIGLLIDEMPVIAKGFDEPLKENMTIAIEPKQGIRGIGMVGIENTFIVTGCGGRCITGDNQGLLPVW